MLINKTILVRNLGLVPWTKTAKAMHQFTYYRNKFTKDELWLVEHYKVFTQGRSYEKKENLLNKYDIPLIKSDRGGKLTYHGPGQQIMYILINIKRRNISIRKLINIIQKSVIETLYYFNIISHTCIKSPGVYVNKKKICSLGLRIIKGCSLHGFALNVCMDLSPFKLIDPCGDKNLEMTQISHFIPKITINEVYPILLYKFIKLLNVKNVEYC